MWSTCCTLFFGGLNKLYTADRLQRYMKGLFVHNHLAQLFCRIVCLQVHDSIVPLFLELLKLLNVEDGTLTPKYVYENCTEMHAQKLVLKALLQPVWAFIMRTHERSNNTP